MELCENKLNKLKKGRNFSTDVLCSELIEKKKVNFKKNFFNSTVATQDGKNFDIEKYLNEAESEKAENEYNDAVAKRPTKDKENAQFRLALQKQEQAKRDAERKRIEILGSYKKGDYNKADMANYWNRCTNFDDPGCVPLGELEEWDKYNMTWTPCKNPTLKPCKQKSNTVDGVPIKKIGGKNRTRRNRKTKKYNIKK